jgi:hypothetical protein
MIWMQHKHIPEIFAGKFTAARMVRVLIEENGRRDVFRSIYN